MNTTKVISPNIYLDPRIICRTPVFALNDQLQDVFEMLKNCISDASPEFYRIIADLHANEWLNSDERVKHTLWKYFNRAKYRSTPYGQFSGISVIPLTGFENGLTLSSKLQLNTLLEWHVPTRWLSNGKAVFAQSEMFIVNSTLYIVGDHIRYLIFENGQFEMGVIKRFPEMDLLIQYCATKRSKSEMLTKLTHDLLLSLVSAKALIIRFISLQLLITDAYPNIIGEDYHVRKPEVPQSQSTVPYIISERKLLRGKFKQQTASLIPELIHFLHALLPRNFHKDLENFSVAFNRRFEMRAIPLSAAIDPELGIGYAGLGVQQENHVDADLTAGLQSHAGLTARQLQYDPLLVFLINQSMNSKTIQLEKYQLEADLIKSVLPNTFSVILHEFEESIVIEHIGGHTANALLGRFTAAIPVIEAIGMELAQIEKQANPEILFFDVGYSAEGHIDNVNRRKPLYDHELPILNWSCANEPLLLSDIYVMVRNHEIILYSKKHRKRVVPKIPSAYNYNRSSLPLFRFLGDLQHQGIRSDLNFRMNELLPHLEHYPRVNYKNITLCPETWLVPGQLSAKQPVSLDVLKLWLENKSINFLFKFGKGDQTLTCDPKVEEDLIAFAHYCKKHSTEEIYIQEALVGENVLDETGKVYASQMVLNYIHSAPVYTEHRVSPALFKKDKSLPLIPPGKEWLYFEIYSHSAYANELLNNHLRGVLAKSKHLIKAWFFVRYEEGGSHLRLRMQLKNPDFATEIIFQLNATLQSAFECGLVSDLQIKTYKKESARYGSHNMELIEKLFWQDSLYVLKILKVCKSQDSLYMEGLKSMITLVRAAFDDNQQQYDFIKRVAQLYADEFSLRKTDFKRLNKRFRLLDLSRLSEAKACNNRLSTREKQIKKILGGISDHHEKFTMLADIIHMHINRLISSDQRLQEAVLYQYLLQYAKSLHFLENNAVKQ